MACKAQVSSALHGLTKPHFFGFSVHMCKLTHDVKNIPALGENNFVLDLPSPGWQRKRARKECLRFCFRKRLRKQGL